VKPGSTPPFTPSESIALDEVLPWSHIDIGMTTSYLKREQQKAVQCEETGDCRYEGCNVCGFEKSFPNCQERLVKK